MSGVFVCLFVLLLLVKKTTMISVEFSLSTILPLSYLATVKSELRGLCQVQHAPFAKGSGAVDSRYGLRCMSMMLRTTALEPTTYDAIVFNFGMHDIDYSKRFPEVRDQAL